MLKFPFLKKKVMLKFRLCSRVRLALFVSFRSSSSLLPSADELRTAPELWVAVICEYKRVRNLRTTNPPCLDKNNRIVILVIVKQIPVPFELTHITLLSLHHPC
jgi:hypothetical protein